MIKELAVCKSNAVPIIRPRWHSVFEHGPETRTVSRLKVRQGLPITFGKGGLDRESQEKLLCLLDRHAKVKCRDDSSPILSNNPTEQLKSLH